MKSKTDLDYIVDGAIVVVIPDEDILAVCVLLTIIIAFAFAVVLFFFSFLFPEFALTINIMINGKVV